MQGAHKRTYLTSKFAALDLLRAISPKTRESFLWSNVCTREFNDCCYNNQSQYPLPLNLIESIAHLLLVDIAIQSDMYDILSGV